MGLVMSQALYQIPKKGRNGRMPRLSGKKFVRVAGWWFIALNANWCVWNLQSGISNESVGKSALDPGKPGSFLWSRWFVRRLTPLNLPFVLLDVTLSGPCNGCGQVITYGGWQDMPLGASTYFITVAVQIGFYMLMMFFLGVAQLGPDDGKDSSSSLAADGEPGKGGKQANDDMV